MRPKRPHERWSYRLKATETAPVSPTTTVEMNSSKALKKRFADGLEMLRKRNSTSVSFRDCQCGDGGVKGFNEGVLEIAEALQDNNQVEILDFSNTRFTTKGAAKLGAAVGSCSRLKRIDLSRNGMSDSVMKAFAPGLKALSTLQLVNLVDNSLSDVGLFYFCGGLRHSLPDGQAKILLTKQLYPLSAAAKAMVRRGFYC